MYKKALEYFGIAAIVSVLVAPVAYCTHRDYALQSECIAAGGTTISTNAGSFHCIAGSNKK
jgi:hypothetical protein